MQEKAMTKLTTMEKALQLMADKLISDATKKLTKRQKDSTGALDGMTSDLEASALEYAKSFQKDKEDARSYQDATRQGVAEAATNLHFGMSKLNSRVDDTKRILGELDAMADEKVKQQTSKSRSLKNKILGNLELTSTQLKQAVQLQLQVAERYSINGIKKTLGDAKTALSKSFQRRSGPLDKAQAAIKSLQEVMAGTDDLFAAAVTNATELKDSFSQRSRVLMEEKEELIRKAAADADLQQASIRRFAQEIGASAQKQVASFNSDAIERLAGFEGKAAGEIGLEKRRLKADADYRRKMTAIAEESTKRSKDSATEAMTKLSKSTEEVEKQTVDAVTGLREKSNDLNEMRQLDRIYRAIF